MVLRTKENRGLKGQKKRDREFVCGECWRKLSKGSDLILIHRWDFRGEVMKMKEKWRN